MVKAQYYQDECIKTVEKPSVVPENNLEEAFSIIIDEFGVKSSDRYVESSHCIAYILGHTAHKFNQGRSTKLLR